MKKGGDMGIGYPPTPPLVGDDSEEPGVMFARENFYDSTGSSECRRETECGATAGGNQERLS